ncbi:DUF2478 domain-containing protein [Salaquimonas pukyongi]|uniref:DUF2478 domain-containing protein n=1 Tax=Salaquimonas pukyongi TaxID=2712698 RepID=UPI00096BBCE1|nr:DUF2478 domain-containing protein [Salaquimonas pukyongi]
MTATIHPIAAIRFGDEDAIDDILEDVARRMQDRGSRVDGFLQRETAGEGGCCATMHLESMDGQTIGTISQNLGRHSRGCRLDPAALAALCGPLITRLDVGCDLLIINRFGKGESLGAGFRSAIEHAFLRGIPVLTAVRKTYLEAWMAFTNGEYCLLPPQADAVEAWALQTAAANGPLLRAS